MNALFVLITLGLRACYFVACVLALAAYGRTGYYAFRQMMRSRLPAPEDFLPVAFLVGALAGLIFMGKRMVMATFFHQAITFDRDALDSATTGIAFALLTASNFIPPWCKARYAGNDRYGVLGICLVVGSGIAFAAFYASTHHITF